MVMLILKVGCLLGERPKSLFWRCVCLVGCLYAGVCVRGRVCVCACVRACVYVGGRVCVRAGGRVDGRFRAV